MPTYEYACRDCGEHLEVVQSFKDDALTDCPSCSGRLRKVFSAAGIIFKGSGWHVKDYADTSRSGGSSGSADGDGAESNGSKDGGSTADKEPATSSSESTSSESSSSKDTSSSSKASSKDLKSSTSAGSANTDKKTA